MELSRNLQVVRHCLMPGQTINAVIKKFNLLDISKDEMDFLIEQFKKHNTQTVFKPGMSVFVPILERHAPEVFKYPSKNEKTVQ